MRERREGGEVSYDDAALDAKLRLLVQPHLHPRLALQEAEDQVLREFFRRRFWGFFTGCAKATWGMRGPRREAESPLSKAIKGRSRWAGS